MAKKKAVVKSAAPAKSSVINEVAETFILAKRSERTVQELSEQLNIEEAVIEKYLALNPAPEPKRVDTPKTPAAAFAKNKDQYETQGQYTGPTVMTSASSEIGDEARKNRIGKESIKQCITKIKR